MCQSPISVVSDHVVTPPHVTLSGDLFFIDQVPFFAIISHHVKFTAAEHVLNQKSPPQLVQASKHAQSAHRTWLSNQMHAHGWQIRSC
jgi:hypothetical protein